MKVLIVGLGLMGGAYAYRLKKAGYEVYASDLNDASIEYGKANGFIDDGAKDPSKFISKVDIIILAIYPTAILGFIDKYHSLFNENLIITDICGVKSSFVALAEEKALPAIYLSHHPMAGREKSGIDFSKECVFEGANYLITTTPKSQNELKAIDTLKKLGVDLGFARITVIDILTHDEMIGFTSQLTHAIAVSLVNSDHNEETKNFIGDSYRDLTRIARINENLWSELFLENKDFLINHIESFEAELNKLKKALYENDREELKDIFRNSTKIRSAMDK